MTSKEAKMSPADTSTAEELSAQELDQVTGGYNQAQTMATNIQGRDDATASGNQLKANVEKKGQPIFDSQLVVRG